jgi:hypothetical protein
VAKATTSVPVADITRSILVLRGQRVLLDTELAALYGVEIRVLVQAVKRNLARFPEDFMFQLTALEWAALRSQSVTLKSGRGQHRKYLPYVFTEQGVAMLSSVLGSERAIAVNIEIMRAFVRMRELLSSNKELARRFAIPNRPRSSRPGEIFIRPILLLPKAVTSPITARSVARSKTICRYSLSLISPSLTF